MDGGVNSTVLVWDNMIAVITVHIVEGREGGSVLFMDV